VKEVQDIVTMCDVGGAKSCMTSHI